MTSRGQGLGMKQAVRMMWRSALALAWMGMVPLACAQAADPKPWQMNMGRGVTQTAHRAWEAHMVSLWVCVGIGVIVFGAMGYAMFRFRRARNPVPATFTHNTRAELIWTIIPVVILVAMAWPATAKLIAMYDTRDSEMTVKITGYQWMWKYEYLGQGVSFTSRLARHSDQLRQSGQVVSLAQDPHYLLEVDHPLVLPVDTKVRFVVTADDVIHSWWVPALGWKQDAIPGLINEAWTNIETPGTYRGQCAELCGKDHGFMPIVVQAVSKEAFKQWLAEQKPAAPAAAPVQAAPAPAGDSPAPSASADGTAPSAAAPTQG